MGEKINTTNILIFKIKNNYYSSENCSAETKRPAEIK